ncbi:MAG: hypothetical protein AB1716_00030 [Planctomycetota bacterium]
MRPEDVLRLLRSRPFRAFRIHLSDGTMFEIRHPELAIVERSTVVVGVPGPEGPNGPVERTVFCALVHITRLEPLDGAAA